MNFNKHSLIALSIAVLVSGYATAQTVQEFERQRTEIIESDRTLDEKIDRLKKLKELAVIQMELERQINPPKPVPVKEEAPKEVVKKKPVATYRPPVGFETDTVYVSEIFTIANNASAEFYVNGEPVPVNLGKAKTNRELFASKYYVIAYDDNSVTFRNRHNGKAMKRRLMSTSLIKKKIEYNNELIEEYQKAYALGSLEVELQSALEESQSPVQVSYPTAAAPKIYDSMAGN